MAKDKIVILVSHRLYAGKNAKNIYVLDDGKLVEEDILQIGQRRRIYQRCGWRRRLEQGLSLKKRTSLSIMRGLV